jgi:DNA helicase-2/ATP-dependent DNA helicase PcrA
LDREDVDFMIKDPKHNFFTNWCILDLLAFIKVALVPNDIQSFERIYYKMNAYLSKAQLHYIKEHYNGINLFESLVMLPDLENFKLKNLRKIKAHFEYLTKLTPAMAIEFIEDELNYRAYLVNNCQKQSISLESQNKYIDVLKVIAKRTNSLTDFLLRLDELKKIIYHASSNKNPFALKLLTMHASKGLEFDHVFIIDVDHHVFPSKYAQDLVLQNDLTMFEEERRLFYVALSRAKSHLSLVHTKFKNGQYNKASEFVKDYISSAGQQLLTSAYSTDKKDVDVMNGFQVGDKLLHTSFGIGILVDITGDRIMIEFKDVTKTLSASICLDSKIIMKID